MFLSEISGRWNFTVALFVECIFPISISSALINSDRCLAKLTNKNFIKVFYWIKRSFWPIQSFTAPSLGEDVFHRGLAFCSKAPRFHYIKTRSWRPPRPLRSGERPGVHNIKSNLNPLLLSKKHYKKTFWSFSRVKWRFLTLSANRCVTEEDWSVYGSADQRCFGRSVTGFWYYFRSHPRPRSRCSREDKAHDPS